MILEPSALLAPGFKFDEAQSATMRLGMEVLLTSPSTSFEVREFQRLDLNFHGMIAQGSTNRFVSQALMDHLNLRRLPSALHGVNVFRLKQSTREHLAMLGSEQELLKIIRRRERPIDYAPGSEFCHSSARAFFAMAVPMPREIPVTRVILLSVPWTSAVVFTLFRSEA